MWITKYKNATVNLTYLSKAFTSFQSIAHKLKLLEFT